VDLPKVNIAVAASAVVAIVSSLGGGIWYASSQASIIDGLTSQVEKLTIENSATDRTNLIRDVEQNADNIEELTDILSEFYDDMEDSDNDIWADIDMINEDMGGMAAHMMEIIKLQSRVAILEKTVEFSRNDGM
jgi:ABC-type transporter Mla subunit MlaD